MNAMPDFLADAADQPWFEMLFERLLAPLDAGSPCGPAARHDPMVTEIRLLRDEDDPSLPMGQWERPLKLADWPLIEQHCITLLCERSKDLQTVVWLMEAWVRQRGFVGLSLGLRVLDALLRRYWTDLHPQPEDDGDCDARLAPLEWLNETLSTSIRVHAALFTLDDWRPPQVTLADWERLAMEEAGTAASAPARHHALRESDIPLTRTDLVAAAGQLEDLVVTDAAVKDSIDYLASVTGFLLVQLREQAPRLAKLHNVLAAVQRAIQHVQAFSPAAAPSSPPMTRGALAGDDARDAAAPQAAAPETDAAPPTHSGWRDRNDAYVTLQALAEYLAKLEPHSPTPFLLRRAVRWGSMPLPEVLAEIIREEGDLNRLVNVLGLQT